MSGKKTEVPKNQFIYLITHCESCYNQLGVFTGRVDSVLTKQGHDHAIRIAKQLKHKQIDIAFVSPLTRTKQTLRHILKYHPKAEIHVDKRIIERDYGELSRKSKAKYKLDYPNEFPIYNRS